MKKICIIAADYPPNIKGGGEKSNQLLARGLADLDNNVSVLTIDNSESEFMDENVSIKTILTPNIYWNFKHTETLFKELIIEGETGLLFDPSHSENFKHEYLDAAVANNLTSQSASTLVQVFCNKFSTPLISSQYDAFLDKLIHSVNE